MYVKTTTTTCASFCCIENSRTLPCRPQASIRARSCNYIRRTKEQRSIFVRHISLANGIELLPGSDLPPFRLPTFPGSLFNTLLPLPKKTPGGYQSNRQHRWSTTHIGAAVRSDTPYPRHPKFCRHQFLRHGNDVKQQHSALAAPQGKMGKGRAVPPRRSNRIALAHPKQRLQTEGMHA